MLSTTRRDALTALGALALAPALPARAQGGFKWPVGTIKLMSPSPPGGAVDLTCRRIGERLAALLGVNVIIDNKAGAAGQIGAQALAAAPADGSYIGYLHAGHVTLQAMGAKFDLLRDFTPVLPRFSASQFVIAVHVDSPYKTLAALLRAIVAQPGKLSYGSGGIGTPGHMTFETLRLRVPGLDALYVPFKGAADSVNAVVSRDLDFASALMAAVLAQVRSGKVRALAVSGATRSAQMPEVPTIAESGYPGFNLVSWGGVFGPAKLPPALVGALRAAIVRIGGEPEYQATLQGNGSELSPAESTEEFTAYCREALARESVLVKKLDLKIG